MRKKALKRKQNKSHEEQHLMPLAANRENQFENESLSAFICQNGRRSIPTIFTYDFSLGIPTLGIMMTNLGFGIAAPSTTTMLNSIGFVQVGGVLPSAYLLESLFVKLASAESKQQKLLEEKKEDTTEYQENIREISEIKCSIARVPKNALIGGLIYTPVIFTMLFSNSVLIFFRQSATVASTAQTFFRPYTPFYLAYSLRMAFEFVLLATKMQTITMLMAITSLVCSIGMQYGLGFNTSLNLIGLSIGAGFGVVLTSLFFVSFIAWCFKNFGFFKSFFTRCTASDWQQIREFIIASAPITLTIVSDFAISFATSLIAGTLSEEELNTQNVATQFLNINSCIVAAVGQITAMIAAGQREKAKFGKASYESIKLATSAGIIVGFILQCLLVLFACAFSSTFINITGASVAVERTRYLLLLTSAYVFIDAPRYIRLQTTRALNDNLKPALASIFLLWVGVGISYLLSSYTCLGVLGLPLGLCLGALVGAIALGKRLKISVDTAISADEQEEDSEKLQENEEPQSQARISDSIAQNATSTHSSWYSFFTRQSSTPDYQNIPDIEAQAHQKSLCSSCVIQ